MNSNEKKAVQKKMYRIIAMNFYWFIFQKKNVFLLWQWFFSPNSWTMFASWSKCCWQVKTTKIIIRANQQSNSWLLLKKLFAENVRAKRCFNLAEITILLTMGKCCVSAYVSCSNYSYILFFWKFLFEVIEWKLR